MRSVCFFGLLLAAALSAYAVAAEEAQSAAGPKIKVPTRFRTAAETLAEPYTQTGWAKEIVHKTTGIEMVFIPAGTFQMGSPEGEGHPHERPRHTVRITKPFYMGKYPVTQSEWQKVMDDNPSAFRNPRRPVENVSWLDARRFLEKARDGLRLPTGAEWEYACRAGTTTRYYWGESEAETDKYAWHLGNSNDATHPVGKKLPNAWGLYDILGNVQEWCSDYHDGARYPKAPQKDPTGPPSGRNRLLRGGSKYYDAANCRSASRIGRDEAYQMDDIGFRAALGIDEP